MTLLEIVTKFCIRTGLPAPGFVMGSSDSQIRQIAGLLEEVIEDVRSRWVWQELTKEAVFVTVAAEDQGAIDTIAPEGFSYIIQDTIYNRTMRLPLYGPMVGRRWQALKALPVTGPFYKYRLVRGRLLFNPIAAAGHTCAFEYVSKYCTIGTDLVAKEFPTQDTDTFLLDSTLLLAGLRWMWKKEKGLAYAEEFTRFEVLGNDMAGRDASKPVLDMAGDSTTSPTPGIFIAPGSTVPQQ